VVRPQPGELDAADEGDDLTPDVTLVRLERAGSRPSNPLVLEPPAEVRGQLDPFRAGIASAFHMSDELVQSALRLLPGGETALALLASTAGEWVRADVDDERPGAPLPDVSSHGGLLARGPCEAS
jgi:hypothetical protein